MRSSQKHNSNSGLADAVVSALNCCLKKRLDRPTLETCISINLKTDLFDHNPAKRMPNKYDRSALLLGSNSAMAYLESNGQWWPTSSSSRLSTKLLSKLLAWSIMSAVVFPNAAWALYPSVMTRAWGTSSGRNSLSQKAFVWRLVQVFFESPFRLWTATILEEEDMSMWELLRSVNVKSSLSLDHLSLSRVLGWI